MNNLDYIKSVYEKGFDCQQKREECIANAAEVRMSRGNTSYSAYGMYPPDMNIYILLCSKKYGHLTKKEKGIDNKYFFNKDGKVILMETYSPGSFLGYDVKPYLCTFFEYAEKDVNIVICRLTKNEIAGVAKCEFNDNGQLIHYFEGNYDIDFTKSFRYTEMFYEYIGEEVHVTFNTYGEAFKNSPPLTTTSKYICCNGEIKEIR